MTPTMFDMPDQFRRMIDDGVEQAKQAFDQYLDATHKAASQVDGSSKSVREGAAEVNRQALALVEQNVSSYFNLVEKLMRARSLDEVTALQKDYFGKQMTQLSEHSREVGAVVTKVGEDAMKRAKG